MAAIQWETLPFGTLFRPSEELLLNHYLVGKLTTTLDDSTCPITEVIIATYDPWELPWKSTVTTEREEWYFFVPVEKKNPNQKGFINRMTPNGSWRQSGPDRKIFSNISGLKTLIGMRKHLLFYDHEGHHRGKVSEWIIHEYRLASESQSDAYHEAYVICKLVRKVKEVDGEQKNIEEGGPSSLAPPAPVSIADPAQGMIEISSRPGSFHADNNPHKELPDFEPS